MIALAKQETSLDRNQTFEALLPKIQQQAHAASRHELDERRQELIAEVIANAFIAYVRLVERDLEEIIYATPLAQYAIRQVRSGRRVGCKMNVNDVTSPYARCAKDIMMESLHRRKELHGEWEEMLVENRKAGPAETAASRIDFGDWMQSLSKRQRNIADTLGSGETTKSAARKFGVTPGRISQLRQELKKAWEEFVGEV